MFYPDKQFTIGEYVRVCDWGRWYTFRVVGKDATGNLIAVADGEEILWVEVARVKKAEK